MSEAETTIQRIKSHQNLGFLITTKDHKIVRTNYTGEEHASKVL